MRLSIPHRDQNEPLIETLEHVDHLPRAERAAAREVIADAIARGIGTAADLLSELGAMTPADRRARLVSLGIDAPTTPTATGIPVIKGAAWAPTLCAVCGAPPWNPDGATLFTPSCRRWHCPSCAHLAEPGDLDEDPSFGLVPLPGGGFRERRQIEAAEALERTRLRAVAEQEAARRADAEVAAEEQRARAAAFEREVAEPYRQAS